MIPLKWLKILKTCNVFDAHLKLACFSRPGFPTTFRFFDSRIHVLNKCVKYILKAKYDWFWQHAKTSYNTKRAKYKKMTKIKSFKIFNNL